MTWLPKLSREQLATRRREAARLLRQAQFSPAEIARELKVSRAAVSQWAKQLTRHGVRGLALHLSPGRTAQLSTAQWQQLLRLLKRGALRAGFETDRWTLARMQRVVKREFGVEHSQSWLQRRLHQLGWSPQQPIARALARDDELVAAWLAHDWPRIKKKHGEKAR